MSNYCGACHYDVKQKLGHKACPFNYLYWNFIIENRDRLKGNPRLGMIYKTLERMAEPQRRAIVEQSHRFLERLARDGTDTLEENADQAELDL